MAKKNSSSGTFALSKDYKYLVIGKKGKYEIWNTANWTKTRKYVSYVSFGTACFSDDFQNTVIYGTYQKEPPFLSRILNIFLIETATGEIINEFKFSDIFSASNMLLSPDGNKIAFEGSVRDYKTRFFIVDANNGNIIYKLKSRKNFYIGNQLP